MSKPYNIIYSMQSLDDLKDIYSYIAFELYSQEIGKNLINRIRREIRKLDNFPFRFPTVDWEPWKSMNMHKLPVLNFTIFYLIDTKDLTVKIIRILYSGKNIESIASENNFL